MPKQAPFVLGNKTIEAGTRATIDLPVSVTSDHTPVKMGVHVVHGQRPGPTMFVSAAIHGDEIIGVEIVRRLLRADNLNKLRGTLLAVPIVNTLGFMNNSRYLPDRRDLNRCFPGSAKGSLAARLADIFMKQIVARSDVGIDMHSAAIHRTNFPQIRISTSRSQLMELARAFGPPLILTSKLREGSLRQAAKETDTDVLLYEAGEGLRFDEFAVRVGVTGALRVMHHIGMIPQRHVSKPKVDPILSTSSYWLRAPAGGLLRTYKSIGETLDEGDVLGVVSDPFGHHEQEIIIKEPGLLISRTNLPIVNEGDGIFHVAKIRKKHERAEATIDSMVSQLEEDPLFDEDEII